jgi:hypothetical protein
MTGQERRHQQGCRSREQIWQWYQATSGHLKNETFDSGSGHHQTVQLENRVMLKSSFIDVAVQDVLRTASTRARAMVSRATSKPR